MIETVGFIGLGQMGRPMVARLCAQGYRVPIWDLEPTAVAGLCAEFENASPGTDEQVPSCDVLILMLPNSDVVVSVLESSPGLLAKATPGTTILDMGSSDPSSTVRLAQRARQLGIVFMDAPVTGGVAKASDGRLTIMCGCDDEEELEFIKPVLARLGATTIHVGGVGSGHAAKALNNLLSANGLLAATEAVLIAAQFGIQPARMLEVLNNGSGKNNATEVKIAQFILSGNYDSGFAAELMRKDIGIALRVAAAVGVTPTLGNAVADLWASACGRLPPGADHTEIAPVVEGYEYSGPNPTFTQKAPAHGRV